MTGIPDDAPVYGMAAAERATGLTRRRIRYYEKMGLLEPTRTPANRRLFSQADILKLSTIKRMLEDGLDLQAVVLLNGRGELAYDEPLKVRPLLAARDTPGPAPARSSLGLARLERYEDARAKLLGRGPAAGADRLYPGDARRLTGAPRTASPGVHSPATKRKEQQDAQVGERA